MRKLAAAKQLESESMSINIRPDGSPDSISTHFFGIRVRHINEKKQCDQLRKELFGTFARVLDKLLTSLPILLPQVAFGDSTQGMVSP
jgi:hypothetical protein